MYALKCVLQHQSDIKYYKGRADIVLHTIMSVQKAALIARAVAHLLCHRVPAPQKRPQGTH